MDVAMICKRARGVECETETLPVRQCPGIPNVAAARGCMTGAVDICPPDRVADVDRRVLRIEGEFDDIDVDGGKHVRRGNRARHRRLAGRFENEWHRVAAEIFDVTSGTEAGWSPA